MPLNLPQAMQVLMTGDHVASRAFQLTKNAVDPLLSFVNSSFQVMADGGLKVVRTLVTSAFKADTTDAGVLTASSANVTGPVSGTTGTFAGIVNRGDIDQLGNTRLKGTTVVQKKDDGTEGSLLVQNNITAQGNISNSTGFKSFFDMGYAWANSAAANTRYRCVFLTQNSVNTANYYQFPTLFQPLWNGSIIGIQAWSQGSAGGNVFCQVFKNTIATTGTPIIDVNLGSAGTNVGTAVTYTKGQFPFVGNDYFPVSVAWNVGGNQATQIRLFVEFSG